jgi:hypothetical protein
MPRRGTEISLAIEMMREEVAHRRMLYTSSTATSNKVVGDVNKDVEETSYLPHQFGR